VLTPYWAARVLHATSSGGASWELALCWGMMVLFSVIYVIVSAAVQVMLPRALRQP
jgi:hypothetical protein